MDIIPCLQYLKIQSTLYLVPPTQTCQVPMGAMCEEQSLVDMG